MDSYNFLRGTRVNVTLVARLLLSPVAQKLCRCEQGAFTSWKYRNIKSQNSRLWSAGNTHNERQVLCIPWRITHCGLKNGCLLMGNVITYFWCISFWQNCRFQHDGAAEYTANTSLLQRFYDDPNMETSQHLTSFCEEFSKNEPIPINRGARRYSNTLLNRLLPASTHRSLAWLTMLCRPYRCHLNSLHSDASRCPLRTTFHYI
jgi:hypothetical protein